MIGDGKWVRLVCKCRPSPGNALLVGLLHESHVDGEYLLMPSYMRDMMASAKCRVCGAQIKVEERK